ncbi:MAG: hypothetical protein AAFX44_00170 [Pseudomonadota bacterium]
MTLAWALFVAYLLATTWLGWLGHRQTKGFGSFALGDRAMHPVVVGITLAASTASAATFIVNPGFVYVDGFSAWFHFVPGVVIGLASMLYVLSPRFRRIGSASGALTIPDWIGKRYGSRFFALYFSLISLLSFAFVVLLVGGISIVMQQLLGIDNKTALAITLIFVTGYVFVGGTYAHVLTNMLQGSLMIGVTLLVLGSCVWVIATNETSLFEALNAADSNLLAPVNRDGALFSDVFSIYVAGFVIGAVVACQPHILTKALYVDSDRDVSRYLGIFTVVFALFAMLVSVGFIAHLVVPDEALVDATTGRFRQDLVMTVYLQTLFPDWVFTIIAVVLLAAAMSTLDGLLVSLSTITANDLVLNALPTSLRGRLGAEGQMRVAMWASHGVLVVIAIAAYLINLSPPRLLGVFGQVGVYGLSAALAPPLIAGVFFAKPRLSLVATLSVFALGGHFLLFAFGAQWFPSVDLKFSNPGVTAAIAALLTLPWLALHPRSAAAANANGADSRQDAAPTPD